jgi:hypothetical protein
MKFLKENAIAFAAIGYVLAGVVTFGHAAAGYEDSPNLKPNQNMGNRLTRGFVGSLVWPLYWSWWAFEAKP